MTSLEDLKIAIREKEVPYFTDEELNFYLRENGGDFRATAYQCLIIKAENTTCTISGLTTADSSSYFRRLASGYRPNQSRVLRGVY